MRRTVFDPTLPLELQEFQYAARPAHLKGVRVGIVENTKANSKELLCQVALSMQEQFGTKLVHIDRKKSSGHAVSAEAIARLHRDADIVLAGVGD